MEDKRKIIQITIGSRNRNVSVQGDANNTISLEDVVTSLYKIFEEEDQQINELIPKGIETIKTGTVEGFKSEKILSSLINVGIPIEIAIKTLETAIDAIHKKVEKDKSLTTKEIRRYVAEAIRQANVDDSFCVEDWSYRYVRKYGHDSRRIVIYNHPTLGEVELSYSIVVDIIKDAFKRIIPCDDVNAIGRQRFDNMSSIIMDFINGCDLYYFDYNILINLIGEIAKQPPHPWLITENTKNLLVKYNVDALQSNIEQLRALGDPSEAQISYYCLEIIHHASSLILERYQWFLGENDLSSFYILLDLVGKYKSADFNAILSSNNAMQKLERDLALADRTLNIFYETLVSIRKVIQSRKITGEGRQLVLSYGEFALRFVGDNSEDSIKKFLKEDWEEINSEQITNTLFKVLGTLAHASRSHKPAKDANPFRFKYCGLSVNGSDLKPQFLVVYIDRSFDYSSLEKLRNRTYTDYASVILITTNSNSELPRIVEEVDRITNGMYWCVPMKKEDYINILEHDNPASCFYAMLSSFIE